MAMNKKPLKPSASTALAPKKNTNVTSKQSDIPLHIRNNPTALRLWEDATEEEKSASELIRSLQMSSTKKEMDVYFTFAENWDTLFPRSNAKLFKRGLEAVKKGSQLAGVSQSTIYSVLDTTRFYGRKGYEALVKRADANGVVLRWIHFRTVAQRLKDNKEARSQIERQMVETPMTEAQLKAEIEKLVPSPEGQKALPSSAKEDTPLQKFIAMVLAFRGLVKNLERYARVIDETEASFNGDLEEAKILAEQTSNFIGMSGDMQDFLNVKIDNVQNLYDIAAAIINGGNKQGKAKASARKIKEQIAEERVEKKKKEAARSAALADYGEPDDSDLEDDSEAYYEEEEEDYEDYDEDEIDVGDAGKELFDDFGNMT